MVSSFQNSLAVLAKARFPVLYVETFEERRALAAIRSLRSCASMRWAVMRSDPAKIGRAHV